MAYINCNSSQYAATTIHAFFHISAAIAMVTALPNGALNPNLDRGEPGIMSRPGFPRTQYNMQYTSGGPRVNAGDLPQPPPSKYPRSTSQISVENYHQPPVNTGSTTQISVVNYHPPPVKTGSTSQISVVNYHPKTFYLTLPENTKYKGYILSL